MSKSKRTIESLTAEAFSYISVAQRNGLISSDAIAAGIKPFLIRLLELEAQASHEPLAPLTGEDLSVNQGVPLGLGGG